MSDLHRGCLRPYTASSLERNADHAFQPTEALRWGMATDNATAAIPSCQPGYEEFWQLQAALARWLSDPASADAAEQR